MLRRQIVLTACISALVAACSGDDPGEGHIIIPGSDVGERTEATWTVQFTSPVEGAFVADGQVPTLVAEVTDPNITDFTGFRLSLAVDGGDPPLIEDRVVPESGLISIADLTLDPGPHTLTLAVGPAGSDIVATATLSITLNGAPAMPELQVTRGDDPPTGAPFFTVDPLVAVATATDDTPVDGETLTYRYAWKRVRDGATWDQPTVPSTETERDDVFELSVTAWDGHLQSEPATATVTIANSAPSCSGVVLLPSAADTTRDINCNCMGFNDPDGDSAAHTCVFEDVADPSNPVALETEGACVLPASETEAGMVVRCTLTPSDGDASGAAIPPVGSGVSIGNAAPPAPATVNISPDSGGATTSFTCSTDDDVVDPDGQSVTLEVRWSVGGEVVEGASAATVTGAEVGASWQDELCCALRAGDGVAFSAWTAPACVTLGNTPPEVRNVFVVTSGEGAPSRRDTLSCEPQTMTDADDPAGTSLTVTVTWYIDGTPILGQTGATLSGDHFEAGDEVSCALVACDAAGACTDAETSKNTVEIVNALPSLGGATVADSGDVRPGDILTCVPVGWDDPDGDAEEVTFQWFVTWGGVGTPEAIDGETASELLVTGQMAGGNVITCVATPTNGAESGEPVVSNGVEIGDVVPLAPVVRIDAPDGADGEVTCAIETEGEWLPDGATWDWEWTIAPGDAVVSGRTLTAEQVSHCDLLTCKVRVHGAGVDLTSNTATRQMAVGSDCSDGNPCTDAVCLAAGGCNTIDIDGGTCDDGDPCTEQETCEAGVCVGTEDVCVEDRLSLLANGSRPLLAADSAGGYVSQWYDSSRRSSYLRATDVDESRTDVETRILPTGYSRPLGTLGHSINSEGVLGVVRAANIQTVICNCAGLYTFPIYFRRYAPDLASFDEVNIGNFGTRVTCTSGCMNYIGAHRAETVPFSDGGFGALTMYATQMDFPALQYHAVGSDLAVADAVSLVAGTAMRSASTWDAALVPDGSDGFVVAWISNNGLAVMAQRFSRAGDPLLAEPAEVGTATAPISLVSVDAFPNGRFVVAWGGDGVDSAGAGVRFQRVDETGSIIGAATVASASEAGAQVLGNVETFPNLQFIVSYRDASSPTVRHEARIFSSSGVAQATVVLNETTTPSDAPPTVEVLGPDAWVGAWVDASGVLWTRRYGRAGEPLPQAAEFRANDATEGNQQQPSAAVTGTGSVAVAYATQVLPGTFATEIALRVFDADGLELASEQFVNGLENLAQTTPVVAAGADRFAVVWTSEEADGSSEGILARRYDDEGNPLDDVPFAVNAITDGPQTQPVAAVDADGAMTFAWTGFDGLTFNDVRFRRFDADGVGGEERLANVTTTGAQELPAIAAVPFSTDVVIAWQGQNGTSGRDIFARKFHADGTALTIEMPVNAVTDQDQRRPTIAARQNGTIVVCWESVGRVTAGKSSVACRRLRTSDLLPQGGEYLPLEWSDDQFSPVVAFQADGQAAIAWQGRLVDSAGYGIHLARVSDTGARVRPLVTANRRWVDEQSRPFVVPLDDRLFVGWQSTGQDGSGDGIYFRILLTE